MHLPNNEEKLHESGTPYWFRDAYAYYFDGVKALNQTNERLKDAWSTIDKDTAELLRMRYEDRLGWGEIAIFASLGEDTARKRCRTALIKIQRILGV